MPQEHTFVYVQEKRHFSIYEMLVSEFPADKLDVYFLIRRLSQYPRFGSLMYAILIISKSTRITEHRA